MLNKSIVRIKRTTQYVNKARAFTIYINNKKAGNINDGETKEFQLNNESCNIYAKIDWCRSKPIIINTNNKVIINLEVGCTIKPKNSSLLTAVSTLVYAFRGMYYVLFKPSEYLYIKQNN